MWSLIIQLMWSVCINLQSHLAFVYSQQTKEPVWLMKSFDLWFLSVNVFNFYQSQSDPIKQRLLWFEDIQKSC